MTRPLCISSAILALAIGVLVLPEAVRAASSESVAHVSLAESPLLVTEEGASTVISAPLNMPIFEGDEVAATTGRAEIQFDDATAVRLDSRARIAIVSLAENDRSVRLQSGNVEVRVLQDAGDVRVITPSIQIVAQKTGTYRVELEGNGSVTVAVRSGLAQAVVAGTYTSIASGQTMRANGATLTSAPAHVQDAFDAWSDSLDRAFEDSFLADILDPTFAANALYGNGKWIYVAPFGMAWLPSSLPVGWQPFADGSWVTTAQYGPTWVGAEPWGWVTYHYGNWQNDSQYGWIWIPGEPEIAWQPARVQLFKTVVAVHAGLSPWGGATEWEPLPWYDTNSFADQTPTEANAGSGVSAGASPPSTSVELPSRRPAPIRPIAPPAPPNVRFPESGRASQVSTPARVSAPANYAPATRSEPVAAPAVHESAPVEVRSAPEPAHEAPSKR